MKKDNHSSVLKFFGIILFLFGAVYAILGTIALFGTASGLLPGHAAQETLIIILAYVIAALSLIGGVICVKGILGGCRVIGLILAILGLISLIYMQITQDAFSIFDCIALVLGAAIFGAARKAD